MGEGPLPVINAARLAGALPPRRRRPTFRCAGATSRRRRAVRHPCARAAPIVFGWPAFFFLRASWLHGRRISKLDLGLCVLYLAVCLPIFTVLGTIDAVKDIINDWNSGGAPFQCKS